MVICKYNMACHCEEKVNELGYIYTECETCGWNPEVERKRKEKIRPPVRLIRTGDKLRVVAEEKSIDIPISMIRRALDG